LLWRIRIIRIAVVHKQKNRHRFLYIIGKEKYQLKFMTASFILAFDHYPPKRCTAVHGLPVFFDDIKRKVFGSTRPVAIHMGTKQIENLTPSFLPLFPVLHLGAV